MTTVGNRFWRLAPDSTDLSAVLDSSRLLAPEDMRRKVKPRDGIVLASWDADDEQGRVHALGIVLSVDGFEATVEWRRANFIIRPSAQGSAQWKRRNHFVFAALPAERYRLSERFGDAFEAITNVAKAATTLPHAELEPDITPRATPVLSTSASPQRNRVAPNGQLLAVTARGTFMGNRADPSRWLICALHFERDLRTPRKYTKLFFWDEAVALSAGHRPCKTCRRERFNAYMEAVRSEVDVPSAVDVDRMLKRSRGTTLARDSLGALPDGAFVAMDDDWYLIWKRRMFRWTADGYAEAKEVSEFAKQQVDVMTPFPSLAALWQGYCPDVHPSIEGLADPR